MRAAFLWWRLPPYAIAALRCLHTRLDGQLLVISISSRWGALSWRDVLLDGPGVWATPGHPHEGVPSLKARLRLFNPNVITVPGWKHLPLVHLAAVERRRGSRIIVLSDTPKRDSAAQFMCAKVGGPLLRASFDVAWTAGPKAKELARAAGFPVDRIWQGLYTADDLLFSLGTDRRLDTAAAIETWPKRFVFVGRLEPEKNIRRMLEAYAAYRSRSRPSWTLTVVGDGSLRGFVGSADGVEWLGWRRPDEVAATMASSGAFILPSQYEPWGVVVHEAAFAGLPLLLSTEVGAASSFLVDGHNGRVFDPRNTSQIVETMLWAHSLENPWTAGRQSLERARTWTPDLWAKYFLRMMGETP